MPRNRNRNRTSQESVEANRQRLIPPVRMFLNGTDAIAMGFTTGYSIGSGTVNQIFRAGEPWGQWGDAASGSLTLTTPWTGFYRVTGFVRFSVNNNVSGYVQAFVANRGGALTEQTDIVWDDDSSTATVFRGAVSFDTIVYQTAPNQTLYPSLNWSLNGTSGLLSSGVMHVEYLG